MPLRCPPLPAGHAWAGPRRRTLVYYLSVVDVPSGDKIEIACQSFQSATSQTPRRQRTPAYTNGLSTPSQVKSLTQ